MTDEKNTLPKAYEAKAVEDKIYASWEKSGYFTPENLPDLEKRTETFSIVLPPPNVTGTLHMGHAVMLAIEDAMTRFARMSGKRALWLPGTDHAAIATQTKVEKLLIKEGIKDPRHELGREKFLERVEQFAQDSHDTIVNQMKKLGASVDWTREAYTLDDDRHTAVNVAFKKMYDDGLIYRGDRVINWCPRCKSTIADDEVEYKEGIAKLYTFKYDKDFPISISTTRPETKLGDTAVAVNPKDKRYKKFVGKEFTVEFAGGPLKIQIIADDEVDADYGTGALGVTPAHSKVDEEMAKKNNVPSKQVIDEAGTMLPSAGGDFVGLSTIDARKKVVAWLEKKGLLESTDEAAQNLSVCYRCESAIEPLPKKQWFIDVNKEFKFKQSDRAPISGLKDGAKVTLKSLMQHVVKKGDVKIMPDRFDKTYFHWIDNLRDWNISRQIWFGHQVPVWYRYFKPIGEEYKMGFHERTYDQVLKGKTVTYRQRDHGVKAGDRIALENSQSGEIFGYGTIVNVEKVTVKDVPLRNPAHGAQYETHGQLLDAFRFHHPELDLNEDSPIWIYTYTFGSVNENGVTEMYVGSNASEGKGPFFAKASKDKWEQDTDTLDTWFSSGLWTFSTLGWPDLESEDFKLYHPTSVLETGYDILFFWVARMILMSTYLVGEVPFETVYLHGLVRDENGKKMSKTLGNVIDPLDMIEKYGADATRLSLMIGATPGNDTKLSEEKIASYRNFTNKLWNISRFVFTSVGEVRSISDSHSKGGGMQAETLVDKWILGRLSEVTKRVTEHCEKYEFSLAGELLRDFTWNEFADWYLEIAKVQKSENTDKVLLYILERLLKLWHPFMPFVTEELYKQFDTGMLIVAAWPEVAHEISQKDSELFENMRAVVTNIRNLRARYKISYKQSVDVVVTSISLKDLAPVIESLAGAKLTIDKDAKKPDQSAGFVVGDFNVYVPLAGVIDIAQEQGRINTELDQLRSYMQSLEKKLQNDGFVKNAPKEVITAEREKIETAAERVKALEEELNSLT